MNTITVEIRGIVIKKMDKMLVIIIIFLGVSFLMAAVLVMGAVPKIFQNSETINKTQEIINQTQIQLHEDEAREKQKFEIIRETNRSMNESLVNLENRFYQFMNLSAERSEKGQQERAKIIDNILNLSKKQEIIQIKVQNMTNEIYDLLKRADERNFQATITNKGILVNLTEKLKEIKSRLP